MTTLRPSLVRWIGLALTLGVGSLPFPRWIDPFAGDRERLLLEAVYWGLTLLTLGYVRIVERRPLASLGVRPPTWSAALWGLATAVATLAGLAALLAILAPAPAGAKATQIDRLRAAPAWWLAISVVRAGVAEEVLFRGYALQRLREATGSPSLAAVATWAVFTLAHLGAWSWSHLWLAGWGGAVLTCAFVRRRDLAANVLAHVLVDVVAVFA